MLIIPLKAQIYIPKKAYSYRYFLQPMRTPNSLPPVHVNDSVMNHLICRESVGIERGNSCSIPKAHYGATP